MGKNYTFVRGAAFPYQYKYEHPAVTTDCVIFTYEDWKLKVLLVKRGGEPYKGGRFPVVSFRTMRRPWKAHFGNSARRQALRHLP